MRNSIVEKLKEQLETEIDSEPRAVYVMTQIRKLLDGESTQRDAETLRLCCDWVLHSSLERRSARRVVALFEVEEPDPFANPDFVSPELPQFLSFSQFREEISQVLKDHGIRPGKIVERGSWTKFMRYFAWVIEDVPLKVKAIAEGQLASVLIRVSEIKNSEYPGILITWLCKRRDGRPGSTYEVFHPYD